jgi:hypothetical protein
MLCEQEGGVEVVVRTQETPQRRASRTTLGLGTPRPPSIADVAAWERGRAPELAALRPPHSFSASSLALRSLHSTTAPQASHIRSHNHAFVSTRLLVIVPQAMIQPSPVASRRAAPPLHALSRGMTTKASFARRRGRRGSKLAARHELLRSLSCQSAVRQPEGYAADSP